MFGYRANLLPWIDTEIKGVDLEKFKGRVFLSVDPHLFFAPSFLPACRPPPLFLSIFSPCLSTFPYLSRTFSHSFSLLPLFVSIFHTHPHSPKNICIIYSCSLLLSLLLTLCRSVLGQLRLSSTVMKAQSLTDTGGPFPSHTAIMWGVDYVHTTGTTAEKIIKGFWCYKSLVILSTQMNQACLLVCSPVHQEITTLQILMDMVGPAIPFCLATKKVICHLFFKPDVRCLTQGCC